MDYNKTDKMAGFFNFGWRDGYKTSDLWCLMRNSTSGRGILSNNRNYTERYEGSASLRKAFEEVKPNFNKIEKPDPFFLERLTEQDYEYLLSVAIEKLIAALKVNKLTESESSKQQLDNYKTDQSSVLSFLRDFYYNKKNLDHRPCMEVFVEYEQYCRDTGFKPLKKVNFDREICDELKMHKKNSTWKEDEKTNQCWRFCI